MAELLRSMDGGGRTSIGSLPFALFATEPCDCVGGLFAVCRLFSSIGLLSGGGGAGARGFGTG